MKVREEDKEEDKTKKKEEGREKDKEKEEDDSILEISMRKRGWRGGGPTCH